MPHKELYKYQQNIIDSIKTPNVPLFMGMG